MSKQKITFDSFIRGCITIILIAAAIWLLNYLSSVLLPFFIALLLAYMINPIVEFMQYKCRLKNRILSIFSALIIVISVITLACMLIIPPMIEQIAMLKGAAAKYIEHLTATGVLTKSISTYIEEYLTWAYESTDVDYISLVQTAIPSVMSLLGRTFSFLTGFVQLLFVLLYLVFILIDYDNISTNWVKLIPYRHRTTVVEVFDKAKEQMHGYFHGQALIAAIVGILFAIGFTIIGFPVPIGLGLLIGVLNLVPYMQTIGVIPTVLLALMKAANTGDNFWIILLQAFLVFAVVQTIQDAYLTPRIMGKQMGLNPAIILLSLSVWGALLGIIGLIIALPLTSLLKAYYSQYIQQNQLMHEQEESEQAQAS